MPHFLLRLGPARGRGGLRRRKLQFSCMLCVDNSIAAQAWHDLCNFRPFAGATAERL